jgi:hypothetical protein
MRRSESERGLAEHEADGASSFEAIVAFRRSRRDDRRGWLVFVSPSGDRTAPFRRPVANLRAAIVMGVQLERAFRVHS